LIVNAKYFFSGCNPKVKNLEGLIPKKIADQAKAKDAKKNMRKADKGYNDMTANLRPGKFIFYIQFYIQFYKSLDEFRDWRLMLYDYIYENQERIEKLFEELDVVDPKSGVISTDNFKKILEEETEGYLSFLKPDDIKDICEKHEKERNEFDYKAFLTGKKYLTKPYLMAAFAGKKKKKKKAKKGKKQKGALPSKLLFYNKISQRYNHCLLVAIQDEGPRTANGNPPIIYAPQHVNHTDNTRFSRDNLPKNPLEDDSPWYLDKPDKGYVNLCDAGTIRTIINLKTRVFFFFFC